jgi:hypothetical protein
MTIDATFQDLSGCLVTLAEKLEKLRNQVAFQPAEQDLYLRGQIVDEITDLNSSLIQATQAARLASQASLVHKDQDAALRWLAVCHQAIMEIGREFNTRLFSCHRVTHLSFLMRSRDEDQHEWRQWAIDVLEYLDGCRVSIVETENVLPACWQELGSRTNVSTISIFSSNIGHQMTSADHPHTHPDPG